MSNVPIRPCRVPECSSGCSSLEGREERHGLCSRLSRKSPTNALVFSSLPAVLLTYGGIQSVTSIVQVMSEPAHQGITWLGNSGVLLPFGGYRASETHLFLMNIILARLSGSKNPTIRSYTIEADWHSLRLAHARCHAHDVVSEGRRCNF